MNADFPRIMTLVRKERKISQKQASADLGISQALLSHYEKGIRECGLDFLVKAANYYNVSCDYLLGRAASPQSQVTSSNEEESVSENSKIISDSAKIIMKLCENNEVSEDVSDYIKACIYQLLRIIYNSNLQNDKTAFKIPADECENLSDCMISMKSAEIKRKCRNNGIRITISELSENFPDSHSILSLIKSSEDKINLL